MRKEFIQLYGMGTRVITPDGRGIITAVYFFKVLVMLDVEYRLRAKSGGADHLPFPQEYYSHKEQGNFHGHLYHYEEITLILRPWNSLKPQEIDALDWDSQSIYWAKKSKKGVITYDQDPPHTFRCSEYAFLMALKIDLFDLAKKGIAVNE